MTRRGRETASRGIWFKLQPEVQRMRAMPTAAEAMLWQHLRGARLGARFRRQHAIDRFIVDFVCLPAFLVVEVDGAVHREQTQRDSERDSQLRALGFHVLRFRNDQVLSDLNAVVAEIERETRMRITSATHAASPSPPGEGAGG